MKRLLALVLLAVSGLAGLAEAGVPTSSPAYSNPPSASTVGLGNVDNTSDMDKPVSTAQQSQFADVAASTNSAASSLGDLATSTTAIAGQLSDLATATTTASGRLDQVATDTTTIASSLGSYLTTAGAASTYVPQTTTVAGHALSSNVTVSASDVGLGSVNNTSDAAKPISGAEATVNSAVAASTASIASSTTTLSASTVTLATQLLQVAVDTTTIAGNSLTTSSATATYMQINAPVITGVTTTGGLLAGGTTGQITLSGANLQPLDSDLTALAGMSSNGLLSRTGTGTMSARTLTAGSTYFTVSNGDGVSGNPTGDVAGLVKTTDINSILKLEGIEGADPAGNWCICASGRVILNGATCTLAKMAVSRNTGNVTTDHSNDLNTVEGPPPTAAANTSLMVANYIQRSTASETFYLKIAATFSAGRPNQTGFITATRLP